MGSKRAPNLPQNPRKMIPRCIKIDPGGQKVTILTSKMTPRAPESTSEPPQDLKIITKMRPELKLYTLLWIYLPVTFLYLTLSTVAISNRYQSFNNISTRQHNSNFTPHTSDKTRPTWHVALHTLHFTLPSPHSTRPGGLREAIK